MWFDEIYFFIIAFIHLIVAEGLVVRHLTICLKHLSVI